jgi:hypothetical protein
MNFMTSQTPPNAWLFGGAETLSPIGGTSPMGMIETMVAAVQPDVARDVLGGIANITSPQGGGSPAWPQPESAAPGVSLGLGAEGPMVSEVFKPNSG